MKLTFLGTAAANAYPEAFCRCDNCVRARSAGGPSLRKRSAALINEDLLIDLGPDIMTAAMLHGRPLTGVSYCLQTHGHADHFDPSHLLSRSPGYGTKGAPCLHFYASPGTLRLAGELLAGDCGPAGLFDPAVGQQLNLAIHRIEAGQAFQAGPYQVIAFPADHDPALDPLLYAISSQGRTIFYGTDTASLAEATWQAFHHHHLVFDLVILDHTYGPTQPDGSDHLSARQVGEIAARLRAEGLLGAAGRVLATHIAHEGNPSHPELVAFAGRYGYEIAYDGLTI
jgi:phosphoribosyl 1,2-cyclic phosphate phosphodiesterase